MNCRGFHENLFEYLDDGLSRRTQAAAKRHLEKCDACRRSVHELKTTTQSLSNRFRRDTESLTLDPNLHSRIVAAAEKKSTFPAPIPVLPAFWRPFAWIGGGVALLLLFVFLELPHKQTGQFVGGGSGPAISLRISYCDPIYTFRADGDFVIDSLNCQPRVVEESLQLSRGQSRDQQERKSPL